jgi:hypothetical protein
MKILTPNLGKIVGARVVVNSLYDTMNLGFLTEDLMLIELPDKTYIDVSWFPEHDPSGSFVITVFRDRKEIHQTETNDPHIAVWVAELLAGIFSSAIGNVPCSGGKTVVEKVAHPYATESGNVSCSSGRSILFEAA